MHKDLKDAIAKDNLVLFVGAGMSMPLGFPSWNDLMIKILEKLEEEYKGNSPIDFSYYIKQGSELDILKTLSKLEAEDFKPRVKEILYDELTNLKYPEEKLENHRKLWKISSKIITTNYDKVLEKVKPKNIEPYSNNNIFQQGRSLQGNPYLYKIHGNIVNPDTCILFPSDYEELYKKEGVNRKTFENLFLNKTILFVGFSFDDPFITELVKNLYDIYNGYGKQHFIILNKPKDLRAYKVKTIEVENWKEAFDEKLDELIALKEENQSAELTTEKEKNSVDISKETDLVKLKNIFDQKKKELKDVGELDMKEAFRELYKIEDRIQELRDKELDLQQLIPNHNQHKLEFIFDKIFSAEKLSPKLIQDINNIREQYSEENEWYHRSVLVSALACSIVNSKKLDPRKLDLLIDFTNDSEDKVWQKAITYLFLVLNHLGNKWIRYKGVLQPKLKGLQEKPEIQEALKTIIALMQWELQRVSPVNEKVFENEYFKDSPFNYFLPFYKDNSSVKKLFDDDNIEEIEEYIEFLYNTPLSDAFKYLLCNTEKKSKNKETEETEQEKIESKIMIMGMLSIHHAFEPYLNYVNDFLNFYKNYPKSLKEIKQEVTVVKINKLKNILLNTVEEHRAMARQFTIQEDWGKAIIHYEQLLEIKHKDKSALLALINCYDRTKKNNDDKLKLRLQIKDLIPEEEENIYSIAEIYYTKKKYKTSLKYINEAINLDQENARYYSDRGLVKKKLKDYEEAILDYDKAIKLEAKEAIHYSRRGDIKSELKYYKEALLDYDKTIELDSLKSHYYNDRGNIKDELEDYKGALLDYDKAIELNNKKAIYYCNRGATKDKFKNYEGALLDYDKAIELNNKKAIYYILKANTYRSQKILDKAHEFCDKALKLDLKEGRGYGTKAAIYSSEGKEELFYEYLEKALKLKAKASWLEDDIQEKYKNEKRFQELLEKYNQTLEEED